MEAINTKSLLNVVFDNPMRFIEARLLLNGGYATHFLFYNGKVLFDEGIDGENRKTCANEFQSHYNMGLWKIDNIVERVNR